MLLPFPQILALVPASAQSVAFISLSFSLSFHRARVRYGPSFMSIYCPLLCFSLLCSPKSSVAFLTSSTHAFHYNCLKKIFGEFTGFCTEKVISFRILMERVMDGRMKISRQLSPEKSPKYRYDHHYTFSSPPPPQQRHAGKVPVVYYLCRNRQLEHPHFMEVPLSCDDLYLRDVIERLNVLRGRGIASMYSWSCKRSYKNGFVWHDLCDDDVILPSHGNEYILKGSELFKDSNPGGLSPAPAFTIQGQRNQEESLSSPSSIRGTVKSWRYDMLSHPCASPEADVAKNPSWNGSLNLTEYKSGGTNDASTQTEEKAPVVERAVSIDDGLLEPPSSASLSGRTNTLESLIRADLRKLRILEEEKELKEGFKIPSSMKLRITNMIVQFISCGSIHDKDHSFGLMGMRMTDKKCFSGSLAETKLVEENLPTLKRSSSCNADGSSQQHIDGDKREGSSKCIPLSIKASFSKQLRFDLLKSPLSESSRTAETDVLNESKRKTEPLATESVIKIEERLASGARVVIQSKVSCYNEESKDTELV